MLTKYVGACMKHSCKLERTFCSESQSVPVSALSDTRSSIMVSDRAVLIGTVIVVVDAAIAEVGTGGAKKYPT